MEFCKRCGLLLPDGAAACPRCGAAAPTPQPAPESAVSALPAHRPDPAGAIPPAAPAHPHGTAGHRVPCAEAPLSTGAYFGLLLLFMIPVAGLVLMVIMALGDGESRTRRNLARACLLRRLVGWVLAVAVLLLLLLFFGAIGGVSYYLY